MKGDLSPFFNLKAPALKRLKVKPTAAPQPVPAPMILARPDSQIL